MVHVTDFDGKHGFIKTQPHHMQLLFVWEKILRKKPLAPSYWQQNVSKKNFINGDFFI